MKQYPVTIDNGSGEELTFLGRTTIDGVENLLVENRVGPGSGPPMHVHHQQHEEITIVEGTLATQVLGQEPRYYKAGDTVRFEAGVPHRFWNSGNTVLRCTGKVWPIHNLEYFLTEMYRSVKASKNHRPSLVDTAFLLTRYKSEFAMPDLPVVVRKVMLPIVYRVGQFTGAYKKFVGAPESLK
jgi:uncharacterized cupin superfamily protein